LPVTDATPGPPLLTPLSALDCLVVGRRTSLFADDLSRARSQVDEVFRGARILVIGGGGSVGSSTVRLLLQLQPAAVHVVDVSENYLAELVRDVRSSVRGVAAVDFRTLPLDYGSGVMRRFLADADPYAIVLNFAALKHVRSEKDVYSVLQMLDTNVVKHARFKSWLRENGHGARYFAVSTDKAANPSSLMGASKRLMEDVAFDFSVPDAGHRTSARFANVAFSNGSLLQSFLIRLEKRQPLAAPGGTSRYFITLGEAGEICVLAAAAMPDGHLAVPMLAPETDLQSLVEIATKVLWHFNNRAVAYDDEAAAQRDLETLAARNEWPLVVTPLDTSGEKPYETFVGDGEFAVDVGLAALQGIRRAESTQFDNDFMIALERAIDQWSSQVAKSDLVTLLSSRFPSFRHVETGKNLDQRI